jgi:hypothetical protein
MFLLTDGSVSILAVLFECRKPLSGQSMRVLEIFRGLDRLQHDRFRVKPRRFSRFNAGTSSKEFREFRNSL